tara:strand:- start:457 stop:693 length:237 start_codon:yes stop_codon:yes gene_type:complete
MLFTDSVKAQIASAYAIAVASQHAEKDSFGNAAAALEDAEHCYKIDRWLRAWERARTSLAYSVGIGHPAFLEIAAMKK